jgi:hypothetical protein
MSSEDAVKLLKGPKGTAVNISIRRRGYDQLIDLQVTRDEVNIVSVRGFFMIDSNTGYLKLGEFTETSNHEVGAALEQLTAKGMKRLVVDLRDNPGGALDQAIAISNRFLPQGDMIVYTKGRTRTSDQVYRATEQSDYTHLPVVVMVNRNSASASEIVSGALQDHDRALVVGETTFGKALVQSVYKINEGAGLALTTGRYYTPSGRMIQRPWDGAFDEYLTYTLREQKGERQHSTAELKYTDAGRKVYSGGGIEPDKFMAGPVEGFASDLGQRPVPALCRPVHGRRRYPLHRREQEQEADREGLQRYRRNAAGLPGSAHDPEDHDRRRGPQDRPELHQGLDPLRNRSGAVWRGRSAQEPDTSGSAGEVRPRAVRGSPTAHRTGTEHDAEWRPVGRSPPNRAFGRYILGRSFSLPLGIGAC